MNQQLIDRMQSPGPKKILALDGGGIRGIMTVEILDRIENLLRRQSGQNDDFVLADYFDFVAGTSTGAIIAACIAIGMRVADIRTFYIGSGEKMFDKAFLLKRFHHKYEDENLALKLQEVFGKDTTLGCDTLKTVLMMVMRNATTDSPWPVSNNPFAKYNQATRPDCNLHLPLWQLVRASTAAPVYFPPEVVKLGAHTFVFVDGGITTYNNPAFQAVLMATVEPYKMNWPVGEDQMLVVSIGTGTSPKVDVDLSPDKMNLLYNAGSLPSALMHAALNEQDTLCRVFGKCLAGDDLDREVGNLIGAKGPVGPSKLFTYMRYNAELTREGLDALGLNDIDPEDVQQLRNKVTAQLEIGMPFQAVYRIMTKRGPYKWVSVKFYPFHFGAQLYLYAQYTDIDALKHQEQLLQQEYRAAQDFLDSVADTYSAVRRANLTRNQVEIVRGTQPLPHVWQTTDYDASVQALLTSMPRDRDRRRCRLFFSRE